MKKSQFVSVVLVITGLILVLPSHASAQIIFFAGDSKRVSQINNLDVNGTLYNVTFDDRSFSDIWGDQPNNLTSTPTFWGDDAGAKEAINAMNALLTPSGATAIGDINGDDDATRDRGYYVPYGSFSETIAQSRLGAYDDEFPPAKWVLSSGNSIPPETSASQFVDYAIFTPVPEPTSLTTFGTLCLVAGLRRKRKFS